MQLDSPGPEIALPVWFERVECFHVSTVANALFFFFLLSTGAEEAAGRERGGKRLYCVAVLLLSDDLQSREEGDGEFIQSKRRRKWRLEDKGNKEEAIPVEAEIRKHIQGKVVEAAAGGGKEEGGGRREDM